MILIRHGQSHFNVVYGETRQDPGIRDPGLTPLGREQARAAAEKLAAHGISRLVSSPYRRALETAEIIGRAVDLPVTVDVLVRERRAFICDIGTQRSSLCQQWPHLDFAQLDEDWWPVDEESEHKLLLRCHAFRTRMAGCHDWGETAIVSHWGFIRGLTGQALGNGEMIRFDPR